MSQPLSHLVDMITMVPTARVLPLLLASRRFESAAESQPLDRVRMQKGIFLLEMRGPATWRDAFEFRPYNWGPYSRDLTSTLDSLVLNHMLKLEHGGTRYPAYWTSPIGDEWLDEHAVPVMDQHELEFIGRIREFVTTRSFDHLLRDVYAAFPTFAVASQFKQ